MADQEHEEIGWTKPQKSFKLKKFGKSQRNLGPVQSKTISVAAPKISQPVKRRNPFASVSNSAVLDASSEDAVDSSDLVFAQNAAKRQKLFKRVSSDSNTDSQDSGIENSQSGDNFPSLAEKKPTAPPIPNLLESPPLDWSLKTRLRFVSPSSLGWTQHLSTLEEASGVTGGVRCLNLARGDHCLDTSLNAQFHSCCVYWQYPSIPGLNLFPRYTLGTSSSSILKNAPSLPTELAQALQSDWMTSLQSVYQLVKARQCPYFYLLGPHFTILFRAAGISGGQEISACISPTTSGFRAALKREEIEFSLPLYVPKPEESSDPEAGAGMPEEDGTSEFLESLGIEANSLPGLSTGQAAKNRLAAGSGSAGNIDGRAESVVLVEGVECQSLLNYLLNAKLTVAGQGVSGLPPTILAPLAFHGASLRSLRVRQGQIGRGPGALHSIEVVGPVLPHTVQRLARLATSQSPELSITLHPLSETAAFSTTSPTTDTSAPAAFASANLGDCGLQRDLLPLFTRTPASKASQEQQLGEMVRDLQFRQTGWTFNTAN